MSKETCFTYLTGTAALSRAVAIGIMANIKHESNFYPTIKGDSGTSYGLCQWHKSRWERLKTYCADNGHDIKKAETQLRFMIWEFQNFYKKAWEDMLSQPDTEEGAAEVAYIMCVKYEIPANKESSGKKRGKTAQALWDEFSTVASGKVENSAAETKPAATGAKRRLASYRVQAGDTLTKIAWSFNTSVGDIMSVNSKIEDPDRIIAGELIKIPGRTG